MSHVRHLRWLAGLTALLVACTTRPRASEEVPTVVTPAVEPPPSVVVADRGPSHTEEAEDFARGCLTLRDVAASDVVRLDGHRLYYLDEGTGFWGADVTNPDDPRPVVHVPHVGSPLYLFVRNGIAWVAFVDWDQRWIKSPAATVIRAIDLRDPERALVLGEVVRDGIVDDARLVGGIFYLLHGDAKHALIESFGIVGSALRSLDRARVDGRAVELAASSAGLAAITTEPDATTVSWFGLPVERPGAIDAHESVRVKGTIPTPLWEGARVAAADDGQTVHVVTCETSACSNHEGARLHVVDFSGDHARIGPELRINERGGLPVVRFFDGRLYATTLVEDRVASGGEEKSDLRVVDLYPIPRLAARLRVRGVLTTLVPREGSLIGLAAPSATEGRGRLILHDIDVRRANAPRLRGSAEFGSDWTWATGGADEAAISFDPTSRLAAVPFTAFRDKDALYGVGTQLVDLAAKAPKLGPAIPARQYVERAVFLDGRLLMIGADGIETMDLRPGVRAEGLRL